MDSAAATRTRETVKERHNVMFDTWLAGEHSFYWTNGSRESYWSVVDHSSTEQKDIIMEVELE